MKSLNTVDRRVVNFSRRKSFEPVVEDRRSRISGYFNERRIYHRAVEQLAGLGQKIRHSPILGNLFPSCQGALSQTPWQQSDVAKHLPLVAVLSANLKRLMASHDLSEGDVAKAAGLDKKTINNMVNGRFAAQIDSLEAVAKALKTKPWCLLVQDLMGDNGHNGDLDKLIEDFRKTDETGRNSILTIAELAARPWISKP